LLKYGYPGPGLKALEDHQARGLIRGPPPAVA
jgi:hypothetical protein